MRFIASLRGGLHLRLKAVSSHPLRCFLTRRIDFFRAAALLLANTRKSERLDVQAHPSNTLPQRRPKMVFSPLYGTFRPHFSSEKWPWIEISIPWIGESMGWKSISMGWIGRGAAWTHGNLAKRRTTVGVRFNGLPYSAQPAAAEKRGLGRPAWPARGKNVRRRKFLPPKRDNLGKKRIFADNQGEEACGTSAADTGGRAPSATDSDRGHENDSQPEV